MTIECELPVAEGNRSAGDVGSRHVRVVPVAGSISLRLPTQFVMLAVHSTCRTGSHAAASVMPGIVAILRGSPDAGGPRTSPACSGCTADATLMKTSGCSMSSATMQTSVVPGLRLGAGVENVPPPLTDGHGRMSGGRIGLRP